MYSLLFLKFYLYVFESHCFQHLSKLSLGIRLCSIDIGAV